MCAVDSAVGQDIIGKYASKRSPYLHAMPISLATLTLFIYFDQQVVAWLQLLAHHGCTVLIGDPGRHSPPPASTQSVLSLTN